MIIDTITFNGEHELFEIRYNILKDFVDGFRVIEFDETFSGKPKQKLFHQEWPKVKHYFVPKETWSKYRDLALSSPNTQYGQGAEHWIREFCQKESIKDCLTDLNEELVFIGDCDEIWDPSVHYENFTVPVKLKLRVYSYFLNNCSNEEFAGTLFSKYLWVKNECLNHVRANTWKTDFYAGWHFTSIGGTEKVKQKLTDSYTKESYATDMVLDNLSNNIENSRDFLGRNFQYRIEEEEWPRYLKENKEKYKHLCLETVKDQSSI